MKYPITILFAATLFAGCATEKPFDVTGTVSPTEANENYAAVPAAESAAPSQPAGMKPQPVFPGPHSSAAPRPARTYSETPSTPAAPPGTPAPASTPAPRPQTQPAAKTEMPKETITPETGLSGKIVSVNANLRFAVLNFPIGKMAATDQRFSVYRDGQKVGEVKVTGPQQDDNIIADITTGEAQAGDEVRQN